MKKKFLIIGFLVCMGSLSTYAQQDQLFTHYMYNTSSVNPGYAGNRGALSITMLNRFQWVGIEGAPMTNMININTPIQKKNMGVGLTIMNDKIGPINKSSVNADFCYRMKISKTTRLCFGLKAGIDMLNANLASLLTTDLNDPTFATNVQQIRPNIGTGLLLQSEMFYIGFSSPRLIESNFGTSPTQQNLTFLKQHRHYYGIAGAVFKLNPALLFKPTTLVKLSPGAKPQVDLTANLTWSDKFSLGIMGRTNDSFGVLLGYNINEQFNIGYSFDYSSINRISTVNNGSHELMLRYDFIHTQDSKVKSPRYF